MSPAKDAMRRLCTYVEMAKTEARFLESEGYTVWLDDPEQAGYYGPKTMRLGRKLEVNASKTTTERL